MEYTIIHATHMGFSVAWITVKTCEPALILKALNLEPTGDIEQISESGYTGTHANDGWYLVVSNRLDINIISEATMRKLSKGTEAYASAMEEHAMCSECSYWNKGELVWKVSHSSDRGIMNIDTEGKLPDCFASIHDNQMRLQLENGGEKSDVDYSFEIPLDMAMTFGRFRPDLSCPVFDNVGYSVLRKLRPSLFKTIFG